MGAGIAEVFARNGYQVVGVELNDEALDRGRQHVAALHRPRGEPRQADARQEQAELSAGSRSPPTSPTVKDCQLVVEAVIEQLDVKQA